MYLKLQPTGNRKKTHLYLVESYRENGKIKQRRLKNYGILEELQIERPNIIEEIKAEIEKLNNSEKRGQATISVDFEEKINATEDLKNIGYFALEKLYNKLKIPQFIDKNTLNKKVKFNLNEVFKMLVFSKIFGYGSKNNMYLNKSDYAFANFDFESQSVYRGMDYLNELKTRLQIHLHKELVKQSNRDLSLVFYDVTNYYFQINKEDGDDVDGIKRRRGVSKEKRQKPIIQMGLFIDQDGIPIGYKLFDGNTNDQSTLKPALEELKETYKLNKIVVIADKGLNSGKNLSFLLKNGHGYIVSHRVRGVNKELKDWILDDLDYEWDDTKTRKTKTRIIERYVIDESGNKELITEKQVAFFSEKYKQKEQYERSKLMPVIEQYIANPAKLKQSNNKGIKKYLDQYSVDETTGEVNKNIIANFNQKRFDEDENLDGFYLIVTSEKSMNTDEIVRNYRGLWKIEDSFKVIKSDLEGRPIYHFTSNRIESHFLICFVSLLLVRLLQKQLGYNNKNNKCFSYSSGAVIEALATANVDIFKNGIVKTHIKKELFLEIIDKLKIDIKYRNMKKEEYVKIKKHLY